MANINYTITFSNIEERDTDFAIIRSFVNDENVRKLFFGKVNRSGELIKVYQSKTQTEEDGHQGESDIIFICEDKQGKFAIFVEDKIAAGPQPRQRERYDDRAKSLGKEEEYGDNYFVVLCAPKAYIDTNKADGYEIRISHEEIMSCLENGVDKTVFEYSIDEKRQGYTVVKDNAVSDFWDNLYQYIKDHSLKRLQINEVNGPRGSKAGWPIFKTNVKGLVIRWKTDRDYIDLEFKSMANNIEFLTNLLKKIGEEDKRLETTKKSMSIRIYTDKNGKVDFHKPFNKQIKQIKYCLHIVDDLQKIANKIKYENIDSFPINSSEPKETNKNFNKGVKEETRK